MWGREARRRIAALEAALAHANRAIEQGGEALAEEMRQSIALEQRLAEARADRDYFSGLLHRVTRQLAMRIDGAPPEVPLHFECGHADSLHGYWGCVEPDCECLVPRGVLGAGLGCVRPSMVTPAEEVTV